MPVPIDTNTALESVLEASLSQLVMLILLLGAVISILMAWALNRVVRNQGKSAASDDKVITTLIVDVGAAIKDNRIAIETTSRNSQTAIENNTLAMQALRDMQGQVLTNTNAIKMDTDAIRHNDDATQAKLIDIKKQLETMGVELSAIRTGVDSIIAGEKSSAKNA